MYSLYMQFYLGFLFLERAAKETLTADPRLFAECCQWVFFWHWTEMWICSSDFTDTCTNPDAQVAFRSITMTLYSLIQIEEHIPLDFVILCSPLRLPFPFCLPWTNFHICYLLWSLPSDKQIWHAARDFLQLGEQEVLLVLLHSPQNMTSQW